jgi:hypothetical protein
MADSSILDVVVQLFLLAALFAGISLVLVFVKARKREKFIYGGRFHFRDFWTELITTFGKGIGWALLIFATLMGSALILRVIL